MSIHITQEITDIAAVVPHALGYAPADSLALVAGIRTPRGTVRIGPVLRGDFGPEEAAVLAACGRAGARRLVDSLRLVEDLGVVFPVVYRDDLIPALSDGDLSADPETGGGDALADVLVALLAVREAVCELGADTADPLWSSGGACGVIGSDEVRVAEDLSCSPVALALVADGSSAADSFEDSVALPEPSRTQRAEVDALREAEPCLDEVIDALRRDVIALAASGDGGATRIPQPAPAAVLAIEELCADPVTRDIVQMLLSLDHPMLRPEDLEEMPDGALLDAALVLVGDPESCAEIVGLSDREPHFGRLRASVGYLRATASLVEDRALPGVLALIAWFDWARGVPSGALHFARAALAASPGYGLAELVESAVTTGVDPRWRRTAPSECGAMGR